jgi:hypothetical protein
LMIHHQWKTALSLALRMLMEKKGASKRKTRFFIGRCCFLIRAKTLFSL